MEDERKLTIEYLEEMKEKYIEGEGYERHPLPEWYALDKAIKALEQEPCEDAVNRKAAKDKLKAICKKYCISYEDGERKPSTGGSAFALGHAFDDLPPVTPTQRWIPVSERLPKERGMYIVTEKVFSVTDKEHAGGFNLMTEQVEFDNGKWRRASFYEVIAWMPLPKPYKAETKECKNCEYYTDVEELHGVTPCSSCGIDLRNFLKKKG